MLKLTDLRNAMSAPMFAELHSLACEVRDGGELEVTRVRVNANGYDATGRYFGALARGERMYRVSTHYSERYVRTTADKRALETGLRAG